jgi:acetyltransferase-like isoleucine patch superfamily enzyme
MMPKLIYWFVSKAAKSVKGDGYQLDPLIPTLSIVGIAYRRLVCCVRSFLRGFSWNKKLFMGKNVELRNRHFTQFGYGVTLGNSVLIDGLSREGVRFGDFVSIGDYTRVEASGTIADIGIGIKVGNNCGIGAFSFIGGAGGVTIGNDVIMGQWVSFHPENHNFDSLDLPIRLQGVNRKGIVVGDDCWVGAKVTFLDGAIVGDGCVIAAGSVVRGVIPPCSIVAGVPAKVIKSRKDSDGQNRSYS